MNKFRSVILLILLLSILAVISNSETTDAESNSEYYFEEDGLTYCVINEYGYNPTDVKILKCSKECVNVNIPATVRNHAVVKIEEEAFMDCEKLISVEFSDTIKRIESCAFKNCCSLERIDLPASVSLVSDNAFDGCVSLKYISVDEKNQDYFSDDGVLVSDSGYIKKCPEGFVGTYHMSADIKEYAYGKFNNCKKLSAIDVDENNKTYSSYEGILCNKDATDMILCPEGYSGSCIIPENFKVVYPRCFKDCELLTSVIMNDRITTMYDELFSGCTSLTQIYASSSLETIEEKVLFNCKSLTSFDIPDSVKNIGYSAFVHCSSLKTLNIPAATTTIGYDAFYYCDSLMSINVNESNTQFYSDNGFLYANPVGDYTENTLLCCPGGYIGKFTIPDSCETIRHAFVNCDYLTSVTIPSTVKSFSVGAFTDCSSLTDLDLSGRSAERFKDIFHRCTNIQNIKLSDIDCIGEDEFSKCKSLKNVELNHGINTIMLRAFQECSSLTSVVLPDTLTTIDAHAFRDCSSLIYIDIPEGAQNVNRYAFAGCSALESVSIPSSLSYIGFKAFNKCTSLKNINVDGNNKEYTSIQGILFDKEHKHLIQYALGRTGEYSIPYGVTDIDEGAFENSEHLALLTIPRSVTHIGDYTFRYCVSLNSIEIPDSVTTIGTGAFRDCTSLYCIHVDSNNASYSSHSGMLFDKNCTTLIRCPCGYFGDCIIPDSVTRIEQWSFDDCNKITSLHLPKGNYYLLDDTFDDCTSVTSVTISEKVLSDFKNYFKFYKTLENVVIHDGTTSIENHPFEFCSSLKSITIPDSVSKICGYAFRQCTSLESINLPSQLESIEDSTFYACKSLKSINMGDKVREIGHSAFGSCTALEHIELPSSLYIIRESTFYNCEALNDVKIPENVEELCRYSFCRCSSLTSIELPKKVHTVEEDVFAFCKSLSEISVDKNNSQYSSNLGVLMNKDQSSLIMCPEGYSGSYTIPSTVEFIEECAFKNCNKLTYINVEDGNKRYTSQYGVLIGQQGTRLMKCPEGYSGSFTVPATVELIDKCAFSNCNKLTSINVEDGNEYYSSQSGVLFDKQGVVLKKCPEGYTGDYEIPAAVKIIDEKAFDNCTKISSIKIPLDMTAICTESFPYRFYEVDKTTEMTNVSGFGFILDELSKKYILNSIQIKLISGHRTDELFVDYGTTIEDLQMKEDGLKEIYSDIDHNMLYPQDEKITEPGQKLYVVWENKTEDNQLVKMGFVLFVIIIIFAGAMIIKSRK